MADSLTRRSPNVDSTQEAPTVRGDARGLRQRRRGPHLPFRWAIGGRNPAPAGQRGGGPAGWRAGGRGIPPRLAAAVRDVPRGRAVAAGGCRFRLKRQAVPASARICNAPGSAAHARGGCGAGSRGSRGAGMADHGATEARTHARLGGRVRRARSNASPDASRSPGVDRRRNQGGRVTSWRRDPRPVRRAAAGPSCGGRRFGESAFGRAIVAARRPDNERPGDHSSAGPPPSAPSAPPGARPGMTG